MQVNGAFEGGFPDAFAQDHLALPSVATALPGPSSWAMFAALAFAWSAIYGAYRRHGKAKTSFGA